MIDIRHCQSDEEESSWALERLVWNPFNWEAEGSIGVDYFPELHLVAVSEGRLVGTIDACPMYWDGDPQHLPTRGWSGMIERAREIRAGRGPSAPPLWVGAIGASVDPAYAEAGLSRMLLEALRAEAGAQGYLGVIAPVRPIFFARTDLPIDEYADLRLPDGRHFDPWVRTHESLGGKIVRVCEKSARFRGSREQWEAWSGMRLPENGDVRFPATIGTLRIGAGVGELSEPSIWISHEL